MSHPHEKEAGQLLIFAFHNFAKKICRCGLKRTSEKASRREVSPRRALGPGGQAGGRAQEGLRRRRRCAPGAAAGAAGAARGSRPWPWPWPFAVGFYSSRGRGEAKGEERWLSSQVAVYDFSPGHFEIFKAAPSPPPDRPTPNPATEASGGPEGGGRAPRAGAEGSCAVSGEPAGTFPAPASRGDTVPGPCDSCLLLGRFGDGFAAVRGQHARASTGGSGGTRSPEAPLSPRGRASGGPLWRCPAPGLAGQACLSMG